MFDIFNLYYPTTSVQMNCSLQDCIGIIRLERSKGIGCWRPSIMMERTYTSDFNTFTFLREYTFTCMLLLCVMCL